MAIVTAVKNLNPYKVRNATEINTLCRCEQLKASLAAFAGYVPVHKTSKSPMLALHALNPYIH